MTTVARTERVARRVMAVAVGVNSTPGGGGGLEFYPTVGFVRQSGSAIHEQGNRGRRGRPSGVRGRGLRSAPLRFVSAASLFDGHDAAINMIRRLLQAQGAEVVHLGHNRSVADIVRAAIQEDADGIAVSSYQGGHNEYFAYMVDMLREKGCEHIRVVVGGGGTIAPHEIEALERHGVEKIYTPEDGRRMGLVGMITDVIERVRARAQARLMSSVR